MKRMTRTFLVFFLIVFTCNTQALCQDVQVRGGFLSDSVKIGEVTRYYLTARYPSDLTILFPDSGYAFHPFEFEEKKYFVTHSTGGRSYDSVLYFLTTFEIDSAQYLNLPVFIASRQDCTAVSGDPDTILLTQLVSSVPDSVTADKLPLLTNTFYQDVPFLLNYPILIAVLVSLAVVCAGAWFIFGKKIRKYFRLKRLTKNHGKFLTAYTGQLEQIRNAFSPATTELTLSVWKKYIEQLESRPYTKLTTREIIRLEQDERLGHMLQTIDKAIYGHETAVIDPLEKLKEFAGARFSKKMEEVKNG